MRQQGGPPLPVAHAPARPAQPSGQRGLERARQDEGDVERRLPETAGLGEPGAHASGRDEAPRDPGLGLEDGPTQGPRHQSSAPGRATRSARSVGSAMTVSPSQFGKRTSDALDLAPAGSALVFTAAPPRVPPAPAASTRGAQGSARHASRGAPASGLEPDAQHPRRQERLTGPVRRGRESVVPGVPAGLRRTASFSVVTRRLAPRAPGPPATASRSRGRVRVVIRKRHDIPDDCAHGRSRVSARRSGAAIPAKARTPRASERLDAG